MEVLRLRAVVYFVTGDALRRFKADERQLLDGADKIRQNNPNPRLLRPSVRGYPMS